MKYKLMVSRNAGITYQQEAAGESLEALLLQGAALDNLCLRWVVEDEEGELAAVSAIHSGIVDFLRG